MTGWQRGAKWGAALAFLALCMAAFAGRAAAQGDTWVLVRADYGFRTQWTDVTDLVGDLIARGGVNGRVAVNNQTMGGDPAPGADKVLRVIARGRNNQEREFDYAEGGFVPAGLFTVRANSGGDRGDRGDRGDSDDRGRGQGSRGRNQGDDVEILWAFYGVQGRMANVTDLVRSRMRDGAVRIAVSNQTMNGDPAPGADKLLIVVYRYRGQESAAFAGEDGVLALP